MKIHITAKGVDLTSELEKYANNKVARIARKVPRRVRAFSSCKVRFSQTTRKGTKYSMCTLTLWLGETELKAEETTQHLYAALDIASVHIEHQLKTYIRRNHRGPISRFRGSS